MIKSPKVLPLIIFISFFLIGVFTLPHYGINWDTINHLPRGQAYLHFFLTGKKNFSDMQKWEAYWQNPKSLSIDSNIPLEQVPHRSLYQSDGTTHEWFISHENGGHPPLSDILSAFFNVILFDKLRLINDIDSYRVYGIFLAACLVSLIYFWVSKVYGRFAGVLAALALATYPLFWSEAHFNTEKDIPETVYWSFLLFFFWKGIVQKSSKSLLIAGVFSGLALGTKFNILFIPFIIFPWLTFYLLSLTNFKLAPTLKSIFKIKKNKWFVGSFFLIPVIGFSIFFISWPFLWGDPIDNTTKVLKFYKTIGTTLNRDPRFLGPFGTNTYPVSWIIYSTPIITLILAGIGFWAACFKIKTEKNKVSLLFLLWLILPIMRVTMPGATVYGGIRQLMEYIPALCILAGLGAATLRNFLILMSEKFNLKLAKIVIGVLILALFIPHIIRLIQIHPNENVYFNSLVGGLGGAKQKNLPSWGNTFGAAYRQGVAWINDNAPPDSKVVLAYELSPNIPRIFFRSDLNFQNRNRSGYLRLGEYALTMVYQGTENRSYYDMYLEKFLHPVYQVEVDQVAILKVWKNEDQFLKEKIVEEVIQDVEQYQKDSSLYFNLGQKYKLSRLEIDYSQNDCQELKSGNVFLSEDSVIWQQLPGELPNFWRVSISGQQPKDGHFIEPFVGQMAQFIRIDVSPKDTCLTNITNLRVFSFK